MRFELSLILVGVQVSKWHPAATGPKRVLRVIHVSWLTRKPLSSLVTMEDNCRITPAPAHKTSNTSLGLFNSLKRRDSKKQGAWGSGSTKSRHFQASRPPPGFVSYQIPNGAPPVIQQPSDNITGYDPRSKYSASAASLGGRSQSRSRSEGHRSHQSQAPTAGVHPNHLHNGGRPYKSSVKQSPGLVQPPPQYTGGDGDHSVMKTVTTHSPPGYAPPPPPWSDSGQEDSALHIYNATPRSSHKFSGEGGKKYRKSPVPVLKSPVWVQEPDDFTTENESPYGRPPLPPCDSDPKPPPRSRPKSWTSTIFNAFRNGGTRTQTMTPMTQEMRARQDSTVTLSSVNTSTMNKKKGVRFLANPKKSLYAGQKFYSLPHFSKPVPAPPAPEKMPEPEKVVTKSRSSSPFGRFVKSFVKGNRGNPVWIWIFQPVLTVLKFRNEPKFPGCLSVRCMMSQIWIH